MNKRGQRESTSEGLTKNMNWVKDRKSKRLCCQLNSNANYIRFEWVEFISTDYFRVIDAINKRELDIIIHTMENSKYDDGTSAILTKLSKD